MPQNRYILKMQSQEISTQGKNLAPNFRNSRFSLKQCLRYSNYFSLTRFWLHINTEKIFVYKKTRDLPGVALVITFHNTFHKKEIEFLDECAFLQILQHDCKNIATMFNINGKNAFGCPLRLGLYLKVECMSGWSL